MIRLIKTAWYSLRLLSSSFGVRSDAVSSLVELRVVRPLIRAMRDNNIYIRTKAAEGLGELGDPGAVVPLITELARQEHVTLGLGDEGRFKQRVLIAFRKSNVTAMPML